MPINSLGGVSGLSTLLKVLAEVCKAIDKFGPRIRPFVPTDHQAAYDTALAAIKDACDVIRAIEYLDTLTETNAPFGTG